jgi:hypothetical protein
MRVRSTLLSLVLLVATATQAASPEASGSVTIGDKTITLAHGRAWRNGAVMGVPNISIILGEKPLAGLDWMKGDSNFNEGQRGAALRIDPSAAPDATSGKEPYRYVIDDDYELQLHAGEYRGWNAATLTAAAQVEEIMVSKGWVHGKIEWKGSLPNPFAEEEVLTAFSATFHLPLEDLPAD